MSAKRGPFSSANAMELASCGVVCALIHIERATRIDLPSNRILDKSVSSSERGLQLVTPYVCDAVYLDVPRFDSDEWLSRSTPSSKLPYNRSVERTHVAYHSVHTVSVLPVRSRVLHALQVELKTDKGETVGTMSLKLTPSPLGKEATGAPPHSHGFAERHACGDPSRAALFVTFFVSAVAPPL